MPRIILDSEIIQEARAALSGLTGALARQEALRFAKQTGCHVNRIYEVTKDVRPARKPRADKGKRAADLLTHSGMRTVAELVVADKLDPDQAIEMARANGHDIPVSLGTTQRYLRQHGLNRRQLRNNVRPHRRFEASAPGEIFQFDISGVKERWRDIKTRRILHVTQLDVSRNHPNQKITRIPIWKFVLVDDYSRYRFVRFVDCLKADSAIVIDFLLAGFREMGIPKVLYTDNDAVIISKQMRRAASILDRAFADSGGFKLEQHLPGNPQATGKVERSHQWIEKFERYIGACDKSPTVDELNNFTVRLSNRLNWTESRATRQIPILRLRSGHAALRIPPDEILNSAFKSREIERELRRDLTFSFEGVSYQLPSGAIVNGERNPFVDWVGQKLTIIWPSDADYYVVMGVKGSAQEGMAFEIDRREAKADSAGDFRTSAESIGQRSSKELVASAKVKRADRRAAGVERIVPGFQKDFELPAVATSGVEMFPRKRIATSPELLAALGSDVLPPSMVDGRLLDYWEALPLFIGEELLTNSDFDKAWLLVQFGNDQNAKVNENQLRAAMAARVEQQSRIVEAKSA